MGNTRAIKRNESRATKTPLKIPGSSLKFLTDCDACQYREATRVKHPNGPFPSVFRQIDSLNREFYSGKALTDLSPDLPEGTLDTGELYIKSQVFEIDGHMPFEITGRLDGIGTRADGQGFVIPDFKTIDVKTQHVDDYSLQLGTYALALENPAPGKLRLGVEPSGWLCLVLDIFFF